jgi:hypothetical protein
MNIVELDDPEAFLARFEPTYAIAIIEERVFPDGTYADTWYWGPDGKHHLRLTPDVTYDSAQALVQLQKAKTRWSKSLEPKEHSGVLSRGRIELRYADLKLAQKNQAQREASRRAYQCRKEWERLNPALRLRRELARRCRKYEQDKERQRRIEAELAAMAQQPPEERFAPAVERWLAGAD